MTLDSKPKRVVALDYPSADAAIALGIVPVGMAEVTYVKGGVQAWTKTALGREPTPELIDVDQGFPFEKIAALRPDVIIATNTYPLIADAWDKLNRIAPVVGHVEAPGVDTWQQGVQQIAKALGDPARGAQLIAKAESVVTTGKANHPELAGKRFSFFNYVGPGQLFVINNAQDTSIKFLTSLGLAGLPPKVAALKGQDGRAQVSPERYETIDADVVIGTGPDPAALDQLARDKLFARLPAVARGAFVKLPIGPATAMAFPSVLSVPYAVDQVLPQVAAAVAKR